MKMYLNGEWVDRDERLEVRNPFDLSVVDTVPAATVDDVDLAVKSAGEARAAMAALSGYRRFEILREAARRLREETESLATLICREEGKTLREATAEIARSAQTLELSGEEAKRLGGEVLPLDGAQGVANKLGLTLRVPCGIVAAITPFNFPLNLVCHKLGPAIAAGNAIVLKPASDTPLVSLKLTELLLEAGLPANALQVLTGRGAELGEAICRKPEIRKISFTGSLAVGERICSIAGLKRVTMELGANSPMIVLDDADLSVVTETAVRAGYANAGQVCISAQRLIVVEELHDALLGALIPRVGALQAGDPLNESVDVGPMVRASDAERVEAWITEAQQEGAELLCGGQREGATYQPAIVANTRPSMKIVREELFGPALAIQRVSSEEEALHVANDSPYGLSAGVFTRDIDKALRFAKSVESGNIHINGGPMWRTDSMPYGGLKESGLGKEGPKYAIEEMTEMKTVIFHTS